MSFAPTPTLGTRDTGMLPTLLVALVMLVLLMGVAAHLIAVATFG